MSNPEDPSTKPSYEDLMVQVQKLVREGRIDVRLTREQRIDWAYGNVKLHNESLTREMVAEVLDDRDARQATLDKDPA